MIMPVMSLAAIYLAIYARLMRSSIIEVSHQTSSRRRAPRVSPARASSLATCCATRWCGRDGRWHAAGALVGGAVVIETVFACRPRPAHFEAVLQRRLSGASRHLPDPVRHRDSAQPRDRSDLPPDRSADDDGSC